MSRVAIMLTVVNDDEPPKTVTTSVTAGNRQEVLDNSADALCELMDRAGL